VNGILLLAFLLQGCEPHCDLAGVPVHGGTQEQQSAVRSALEQMEGALALPTCVDHVRLGQLWESWHAEGAYNTVTRGVRLDKNTEMSLLAGHLRHELCHAVDVQNDFLKGREEFFYYPDGYYLPNVSDRHLIKEAFARTCQVGPQALSVLWSECPLDPDLAGTRLVQQEVYELPEEPAPRAHFEPVASAPVAGATLLLHLRESESGALAFDLQLEDEQEQSVLVDPWTGESLDAEEDWANRPFFLSPEPPADWRTRGDADGGPLQDGTELVTASLLAWTGEVHRTFAWVDGTFAPVDGPCPNESTRFFPFGGELWSGQLEGETLSWGRWLPLP
jgi:hypothetical protein